MTITGGSALPKEDIDRMVKEAEAHAAEDAARREEAETRNQAEQTVYSIDQLLKDNADKLPDNVATDVREAADKVREALKGEDVDAIKTALDELNEKSQAIGQALYSAAQAEGADAGAGAEGFTEAGAAGQAGSDDDVVDAEIVDDEDDTK